jgi:hypothetical protein
MIRRTLKNARIVPGLCGGCQASSELTETAPAAWNIEKIQQKVSFGMLFLKLFSELENFEIF